MSSAEPSGVSFDRDFLYFIMTVTQPNRLCVSVPLSLSSYRLFTPSEPKSQRKVFTSPGAALISRISFSLNRPKSKKLFFLGGRGQGLPWRESVRIYRNVSNQLYMIFSTCKYQCRVWARGEGEYKVISITYVPLCLIYFTIQTFIWINFLFHLTSMAFRK